MANSEAPKKKKKKSAKVSTPRVPIGTRLKQGWGELRNETRDVLQAIHSPDVPTRRMARIFVVSLSGALLSLIGMAHYYDLKGQLREKFTKKVEIDPNAVRLAELKKRQAEDSRVRYSTMTLGTFIVELQLKAGEKPRGSGLDVAEMELVIKCSSPETRYFIEDNLVQVRNQVTRALNAVSRDRLLSPEGKRELKKDILDQVNGWLPKGKIEDLFFSNIVMG